MNNKATIVCLGHDENALLFNASGIKGFVIKDNETLKNEVNRLFNEGIKIFLVSSVFNEEIDKLRKTYNSVYPIFLSLSLDGTMSKDGEERIRKDVERATGINLF